MNIDKEKVFKSRQRIMNSDVRDSHKRLYHSLGSKSQSLEVQCYECMGFEDLKPRIEECGSYGCPLWFLRPYVSENHEEIKQFILDNEKAPEVVLSEAQMANAKRLGQSMSSKKGTS